MTISARDVLNSLMAEPPENPGLRSSTGNLFLKVPVAVPSLKDPAEPGGFQPLVIDRSGLPFLVVATAPRALEMLGNTAPFALEMLGREIVKIVAPGVGLHLDNGTASLAFDAEYVAHLKAKIAAELDPPHTSG